MGMKSKGERSEGNDCGYFYKRSTAQGFLHSTLTATPPVRWGNRGTERLNSLSRPGTGRAGASAQAWAATPYTLGLGYVLGIPGRARTSPHLPVTVIAPRHLERVRGRGGSAPGLVSYSQSSGRP